MLSTMETIRRGSSLIVTIYLEPDDPDGMHLTYRPAVLHARHGDDVTWEYAAGPFAIQFLRGAPLGRVHYHSIRNSIGPVRVPEGAPHGCHLYAVAVSSGTAVHIDAACPEIIIEG